MKTLKDYLDDAKVKTGSDYKTAQIMGVTRSSISNYRSGRNTPDQYAVFQLADILGIHEREIFIALNFETEKNPEKRKYWEGLSQMFTTQSPANLAATVGNPSKHCILC